MSLNMSTHPQSVFSEKIRPLRVLIAEDNALVRTSLTAHLTTIPRFEVVDFAESGEEIITRAHEHKPDVILMDITMPLMDGIKATQKIRHDFPNVNIVMLTCHTAMDKVFKAFNCGANAYCLKDIDIEILCEVMEFPLQDDIWVDPAISLMMRNTNKQGNHYVSFKDDLY